MCGPGGLREDAKVAGWHPVLWPEAITERAGPECEDGFSETPLPRKESPRQQLRVPSFTVAGDVLLCARVGDSQHGHPRCPPQGHSGFLAEAALGWGCPSVQVSRSSLRVLPRSLPATILPPRPTVRRLPAGQTTFRGCGRVGCSVIPPDRPRAGVGRWGGGQWAWWESVECYSHIPQGAPTPAQPSQAEAPGQQFPFCPRQLVVGDRSHPLGLILPDTT